MADYEVIDNFLPEQEFNHIAGIIMGKQFAWHFLEDVAEKKCKGRQCTTFLFVSYVV